MSLSISCFPAAAIERGWFVEPFPFLRRLDVEADFDDTIFCEWSSNAVWMKSRRSGLTPQAPRAFRAGEARFVLAPSLPITLVTGCKRCACPVAEAEGDSHVNRVMTDGLVFPETLPACSVLNKAPGLADALPLTEKTVDGCIGGDERLQGVQSGHNRTSSSYWHSPM